MEKEMIYGLVGEAMRNISAVGKDSVNQTQGFKYRGIDAVMNALNPVMAKLGLFIVPEVLEQVREERENVKSYWDKDAKAYKENKTLLKYSILKIKYTLYAPDGSNVSCVVIGEGMDSGDKASNKAMAVGLKYACFQIFMIPTEEMAQDDPDKESFEVTSVAMTPAKPSPVKQIEKVETNVETAAKLPESKPEKSPVIQYIERERENLRIAREISKAENNALFKAQVSALQKAGKAPNKAPTEFTQAEAETLIQFMYTAFTSPTSTELKPAEGAEK